MIRYNTNAIKKYILEVAGTSPRFQSFLQAQNLTMDMTETKRRSLIEILREKHNARLKAYELYWGMYYGDHWFNPGADLSKPTPKFVNFCAMNVNKHMSFLMNKGFLVETDFPETEEYLQNNWALNHGGTKDRNLFGLEMALMGGVTGDVWIDVYFDKHEMTGEEFIKYEVLSSGKCFPVLDSSKFIGLLYYSFEEFVVSENSGFPEFDTRYEGFYIRAGQKSVIRDDSVVEIEKYDITDIPIIHIQNFPVPLTYYGITDLTSVIDLNIMYDKLLTNISDIVDYHAAPITVLKGAKAGDLVKAPNRVWILSNKDATIENLQLEGDIPAANKLLETTMKHISQAGRMPETSLGKDTGISNTTGTGLATTFMPLYEAMEVKRIMYGLGIINMNILSLKMAVMKGQLSVNKIYKEAIKRWEQTYSNYDDMTKKRFHPFGNRKFRSDVNFDTPAAIINGRIPKEIYQSYITWFPPLPRDEKNSADLSLANVGAKIWSRRFGRAFQGMSERESIVMEQEIIDEAEKSKEVFEEQVIVTNKFDKKKTGLEGNEDVKSEKESQRQENK